MSPHKWLSRCGFKHHDEQPTGASDYVLRVGVFRLRVRVPLRDQNTTPLLWVGYTAGGPLVERQSTMRFRDGWAVADDAVLLARVLRGY